MWRLSSLLLPAVLFATHPVAAFEPQAVLYYKMPFGGQSKKDKASTFGLQLNNRHRRDIVRKRPLLGMELRDDKVDNIRFRNIYLLGQRPKKNRRNIVEERPNIGIPLPGLGTAPRTTFRSDR